VKTETVTRFVAFDDTRFDKEEDCLRHEKSNVANRLVGLTIEQVVAAQSRQDKDLADAIEAVASKIRRARLADGELKRKRKAKVVAQGEPEPKRDAA
jgi:hypothetical protein